MPIAKSPNPPLRDLDEGSALRTILEGTATETGEKFFSALVKTLAQALKTQGAWVTEYLKDCERLRAISLWMNGEWVHGYEYDIANTPCEQVIKRKEYLHHPENIMELYPKDPDLKKFDAVSFMGEPLIDVNGEVMGHLAVLDSRPLRENPNIRALFRIFAARAAAEMQRLRAESAVRQREEKLGRLIDSAMDAIIEVDKNLKVTMVNAAAEKAFGYRAEEVVGKNIKQLLSQASQEKIFTLFKEIDSRPEGQRYLWIPGGLTAKNIRGEDFPAEATLSRFEMNRENYHTLILRDVNERLKAEEKIHSLQEETEYLKEEINQFHNFEKIIGQSRAFLDVLDEVGQVAQTDTTVLIYGETGTGKELIARAIHSTSKRGNKPLIKLNCAAIPPNLIESELFGHEKGAFTGAIKKREGRFSLADKGTLFLDEIGELPPDLQAKLLRVLQEGEFEPVGSSTTKKVDVRLIAATNRRLSEEVEKGNFREDLFYRLNVFPITVPPLRDRKKDIVLLANTFAENFAKILGRKISPLSEICLQRLKSYDWPGNVRELENVIERAVITSKGGELNLDRALPEAGEALLSKESPTELPLERKVRTRKELELIEKENLVRALKKAGWRVAGTRGAAQLLGIPPSTLSSRMKVLGIRRPQ